MNNINLNKIKLNTISLNKIGEILSKAKADVPITDVTFPLYFTSDSVRIGGNAGGFEGLQTAYYTFDLGKMDDGTYWSDYLFNLFKSNMVKKDWGYDIPDDFSEKYPIYFNGCKIRWVSGSYETLDDVTKETLMMDIEENLPPLEGYELVYFSDTVRVHWEENGIMEARVDVRKIS